MAADAIGRAFENFPASGLTPCNEALQGFVTSSPPPSPTLGKKRPGKRPQSWPMARSFFILDEKRVHDDGRAYSIDEFMEQYPPDEALAKWNTLKKCDSKDEDKAVRELVVLVKKAAASLPSNDPTVLSVVQKLVTVVLERSDQPAAAACLTQLCGSIREQIYGFIAQVKTLGVMQFLHEMANDSSNANARQLVPLFNDQQATVRIAAENASKLIFANVSHYAVNRLLPVLLAATEEKAVRSKMAATVCFGALAQCAPRALSRVLPSVVPRLMGLVSDSNPEVTKKAGEALQEISEVLVNPEIVAVKTELLAALVDPNENTRKAIGSLMGTSYVHPIDPASLSLLMPILHWGLRDRTADTKRAAVQVVGSACNLVKEDRDLKPYLDGLLPELKALVLDSIPDTRLFASKAISMLVRRFGEDSMPDLIPWLLTKMSQEHNQIERHGAGLCLAEVLYILGIQRFKVLLPELRAKLGSQIAGVREGFMAFLLLLPVKFPEELPPFIPELNRIVLKGLIDTSQPVQAAAQEVGVQLMQVYYERAEALLLPSIEEALHDTRFKEGSIKLLGYLLARMAGVFELQLEPDEMQNLDVAVCKVPKHAAVKIVEVLGQERRNQLLALLVLFRSDLEQGVANMAGRVLRSICENLGQVQEEIFDQVMEVIRENMEVVHRMRMTARCLGNYASKMLDRVMPIFMPLALDFDAPTLTRKGVLAGLTEIVGNGHKEKLGAYTDDFVTVVSNGLCHPEEEVRVSAVEFHDQMRKVFGDKLMDGVVRGLVKEVEEGSDSALDSLGKLVCVKDSKAYKFLATWVKENPVKGDLSKELDTVLEKASKMQPAPVKPKPKLNASKSALDKKFDKATKATKSRAK